jgi:hypothetical protein
VGTTGTSDRDRMGYAEATPRGWISSRHPRAPRSGAPNNRSDEYAVTLRRHSLRMAEPPQGLAEITEITKGVQTEGHGVSRVRVTTGRVQRATKQVPQQRNVTQRHDRPVAHPGQGAFGAQERPPTAISARDLDPRAHRALAFLVRRVAVWARRTAGSPPRIRPLVGQAHRAARRSRSRHRHRREPRSCHSR